jgi:hypothetical protein
VYSESAFGYIIATPMLVLRSLVEAGSSVWTTPSIVSRRRMRYAIVSSPSDSNVRLLIPRAVIDWHDRNGEADFVGYVTRKAPEGERQQRLKEPI